jgi:hypothetical protein
MNSASKTQSGDDSARQWALSLTRLLALVTLLSSSGATCQRSMIGNPFAPAGPSAPQVLMEGATREQIVAAVSQNSSRVRSLTVTNATITIPDMLGLPLLNANIAAERPGRFRLTAGTAVSGQEIDLGSNDELFWMWVRRNQPPAVYFCRHAQFPTSNIRQIMPVEPSWLLAALGIVDIDPASVFDGPLPRGDGTVELRSWMPSSSGTLQRVTVIEARRALVVEQHIYDQAGKVLLASAIAESHRYYPLEQVSLPEVVSIRLPTASIAMKINLGLMQINQLTADRQQLWTMPTFEGYQQFDLGGAVSGTPVPGRVSSQPVGGTVVPTSYPAYPTTPYPVTPAYGVRAAPPVAPGPAVTSPRYNPLPQYGRPYTPPSNGALR